MNFSRKIVLLLAAVLPVVWFGMHFRQLVTDVDIEIRLVLGLLFAVLILVRKRLDEDEKPEEPEETEEAEERGTGNEQQESHPVDPVNPVEKDSPTPPHLSNRRHDSHTPILLIVSSVLGGILVVTGIALSAGQMEWIGLLLVLFACLRWGLPRASTGDICLALLMLYWIHPLPGQVFDPLHKGMHRWTIEGAEWFLHAINERVWADGQVLRTGYRTMEVTAACGGMRTAVTVFLCLLGTGILFRFRWYQHLVLIPLGLVQVLVLNIARITFMVKSSHHMPQEWAQTFLHDTMGLFLLAAILLVQFEAALWKVISLRVAFVRGAIERGEVETPDRATIYAPFWKGIGILRRMLPIVPFVIVAVAGLLSVAARSKPRHRAMMIRDVTDSLVLSNLPAAERASHAALELAPGDQDLITQSIQIMLLRYEFMDALKELKLIKRSKWTVLHTILRAWAIMGLNRPDEAIAIVDTLPEETRKYPGVAMIRAEFAATREDTRGVVENMLQARFSPMMTDRIRLLYPYLAARQQWEPIVKCHNDNIPCRDLTTLLIVLQAHMMAQDLAGMSRLLNYGLEKWPETPAFLDYIGTLAIQRPGLRWEKLFGENFDRHVEKFSVDYLTVCLENGFRMQRPDYAWKAYRRIKQLDPLDPFLYLAPAQYRQEWFQFRKHQLGLAARSRYDSVDVRWFYFAAGKWPEAPLFDEVRSGGLSRRRSEYLTRCREELEKREKGKSLSTEVRRVYSRVLETAGEYDKAKEQKAEVQKTYRKNKELYAVTRAIEDRLSVLDLGGAWRLLEPAMEKWQTEPRFIEYLAELAREAPGGGWEKMYEQDLKLALEGKDADRIMAFAENAFRIHRPELAWGAYARLSEIDPAHPGLTYLPAMYAAEWFVFRADRAGLGLVHTSETLDLEKLYINSREWGEIPLAEEMSGMYEGVGDVDYLSKCLAELRRREASGGLSLRMQMMYATALGLQGEYDQAHRRLDIIQEAHPDLKEEVLLRHVALYDGEGRWSESYEGIRELQRMSERPRLNATLIKINALLHMDLGDYADLLAGRALKVFVDAPEIYKARAAVKASFGFNEEALFALEQTDEYPGLPILPELFWKTERYEEARRLQRILSHEELRLPNPERQSLLVPPAELAVNGEWEKVPPADMLAKEAAEYRKRANGVKSPFIKDLLEMMAGWCEGEVAGAEERGEGIATKSHKKPQKESNQHSNTPILHYSNSEKWLQIGRDDTEKGIALNRLAMLLARQEKKKDAEEAAREALKLVPDFAVIWRLLIVLTDGDTEVVKQARANCPDDPEIWLAGIVTETRQVVAGAEEIGEGIATNLLRQGYGGQESDKKLQKVSNQHSSTPVLQHHAVGVVNSNLQSWALSEIQKAVKAKQFSIRTFVRAGDYFRKHKLMDAARAAADYAIRNGRGYLPANILGLRCALAMGDSEFALISARDALSHAIDPWPFRQVVAEIEYGAMNTDAGTVKLLELLREHMPKNPKWPLWLGDISLRRGDARHAFAVLEDLLVQRGDNAGLRTMLLTAEAARKAGEIEKAAAILERAYKIHPANRVVLNNLVYTLALRRKTIDRALSLLPKLMEQWGEKSLTAMDTVTVVYLNAGQIEKAVENIRKTMTLVETADPKWLKRNPSVVDIDVYLGAYDYSVDHGLTEMQKVGRKMFRKDIHPLASELNRKVKQRESQ